MKRKGLSWLRGLFDLETYKSREEEVVASIRANVEFRGSNLWILIFAILIASIGLNVNSAAVIIGAMLISPIMGPIVGLGLGVGIYDFALIKKSIIHIAVAMVMSIATACLYFLLTPLKFAHSELLARTMPTTWDVLIGFFGGLAGIIATSSKEKGNVIPGVAIATALIPPLCTAGYGLATGQMSFFYGATYLFFINSVFICLATILIVRYLRFKKIQFVDEHLAKRVKTSITIIVAITIIPSVYIAYKLVLKTIFENRAETFIKQEMNFEATAVGQKNISFTDNKIEVLLIGAQIDSNELIHIHRQLPHYRLSGSKLIIKQGQGYFQPETPGTDLTLIQTHLDKKEKEVIKKDSLLKKAYKEMEHLKSSDYPAADILREIQAQGYNATYLSIGNMTSEDVKGRVNDSLSVVIIQLSEALNDPERQKLERWLKVRTHSEKMRVYVEVKE
ncbi:MAG: DUF389 domain-containing protein [Bacteroidia bacterium]